MEELLLVGVIAVVAIVAFLFYKEFAKPDPKAGSSTQNLHSSGANHQKENLVLEELQKSNEHLSGIKWACRSVALLLAVIVFFGVKLTFQ